MRVYALRTVSISAGALSALATSRCGASALEPRRPSEAPPLASSASGSPHRPNLGDLHGCHTGLRPWIRCGTHSGPALVRRRIPDCLFFLWNELGFSPASYSQTLGKLREYLVKSGIHAGQAQQYTLHSLKTTFLSYMSQLSIPLAARFLQGHRKPPGSAQLYSRDDVWPALHAQLLL